MAQDSHPTEHDVHVQTPPQTTTQDTQTTTGSDDDVRVGVLADAACAKSMLEIVGDIPKALSAEEGVKAAGDEITALVPKCKDSVASAGG
jgi:hypothetical protein